MSLPVFSVVIPTYRRLQRLTACLDALVAQSYLHDKFEVIVVDDAGTPDDLKHLPLAKYPFECRIVSRVHGGAAAARNTGARAARGRFLAFTDDDCRPDPDWLRQLEQAMNVAGDRALVGGGVVNGLSSNPYACATQALIDFLYEQLNSNRAHPQFFTSNNFCVTGEAFHAIGGFDTAFGGAGGEDRELCLRWAHRGGQLAYAPEALVYHAHPLTLPTFLRQHYAYGRGAAVLRRRALVHGYGPLPLGRASFYWALLRYPARVPNARKRAQQTVLFALSQIANTAGYLLTAT
jgi:GT2 family glycosyltransferase